MLAMAVFGCLPKLKRGLGLAFGAHFLHDLSIKMFFIQSHLYKMITLGTTQKWSSWTGGRLIKHLYKMTTNQIRSFFGRFLVFIPTVNAL